MADRKLRHVQWPHSKRGRNNQSQSHQPESKMNTLSLTGVCLLLLFSLATADICTDFADPTSYLYQCNVELNSACEGNCKTQLENYADQCLETAAQAYKDTIKNLCSITSSTCIATAFTDTSSDLYRCNVELASASQSACEGGCTSILEEYADECLGTGADAYKNTITILSAEKLREAVELGLPLYSRLLQLFSLPTTPLSCTYIIAELRGKNFRITL